MRDAARFFATTVRSLALQPGVALPAVLILALGIGLTTALFSYWTELFWPHLDAPAAERVVHVQVGSDLGPLGSGTTADFEILGRQRGLFSELIAYGPFGGTVAAGERSSHSWGYRTSGGYFSFFAARPAAGRLLLPSDDRPDAPSVVVLGHYFWQGTLGGDPAVVGREIRINGSLFTVVGVTSPGFDGHGHAVGFYVPLSQTDRVTGNVQADRPHARWLLLLGRLAPGLPLARAQAAADALAPALDEAAPLPEGPRRMWLDLATRRDPAEVTAETSNFFQASQILLAAAALFLLLGCASIANLLLARATARQREWGIRASLGAGRWRLAGGVLAESLVLGLAGGLLGLPVALLLAGRIDHYLLSVPGGLGGWSDGNDFLRFDAGAFGFALAASLACALLGGLGPALRAARRDPLPLLRTDAAGAGTAGGPLTARQLLVTLQVALSVLLLVGSGLLVRTLARASQADPGIEPRGLVFATLYLPRAAAREDDGQAVYARLAEAARALPGIAAAGVSHLVPLAGWARPARVASAEAGLSGRGGRSEAVDISYDFVGPGYFEALGLRVEEGRAFGERDGKGAPGVVVVNRALARRMWGAGNPLGRRLVLEDDAPGQGSHPASGAPDSYEVVGVVADVATGRVLDPPGPMAYFAFPQRTHPRMTLVVRSAAPVSEVAEGLRRALPLAHPDLSLIEVSTGPAELRKQLYGQRLQAEVAALFGLLGLVVAAVGLFGLLTFSVALRERELGIRQALGAEPGDLLRLVVRQGMGLVGAGVVLGLAGALAAGRLLASLLYGVGATDPATFLAVAIGLAGVGLAACWLPARRAAALDPAAALKG